MALAGAGADHKFHAAVPLLGLHLGVVGFLGRIPVGELPQALSAEQQWFRFAAIPLFGDLTGAGRQPLFELAHALGELLHILLIPVSYTHLRAHETVLDLVCRLLLEKKKHTKLQ